MARTVRLRGSVWLCGAAGRGPARAGGDISRLRGGGDVEGGHAGHGDGHPGRDRGHRADGDRQLAYLPLARPPGDQVKCAWRRGQRTNLLVQPAVERVALVVIWHRLPHSPSVLAEAATWHGIGRP